MIGWWERRIGTAQGFGFWYQQAPVATDWRLGIGVGLDPPTLGVVPDCLVGLGSTPVVARWFGQARVLIGTRPTRPVVGREQLVAIAESGVAVVGWLGCGPRLA